MRKLFLCAFAILCFTANITAQTTKDVRKERQEIRKASKSDLNAKATKAARKDAKKLAKEGWITAPGALPLAKQHVSQVSHGRGHEHRRELRCSQDAGSRTCQAESFRPNTNRGNGSDRELGSQPAVSE